MTFTLETPVMKKDGYPSEFTKFGIVIEIKSDRCRVEWLAAAILPKQKYTRRVKMRTWCKAETLAVWPEEIRIRLQDEKVTLTASGMEYTTPNKA